jgi:hypothetical protein
MSCDSKFITQSSTLAGLEGGAEGILGLLGLSSFFEPVNSDGYSKAADKLRSVQKQINNDLEAKQSELLDAQQRFGNAQIQLMNVSIQLREEVLSESIKTNTLAITIIGVLLMVVIVYLLI